MLRNKVLNNSIELQSIIKEKKERNSVCYKKKVKKILITIYWLVVGRKKVSMIFKV